MPEGDTLHTLAGLLAPGLNGQRVARIEIRDRRLHADLQDEQVTGVGALGKQLLIDLTDQRGFRQTRADIGTYIVYRNWVIKGPLGSVRQGDYRHTFLYICQW